MWPILAAGALRRPGLRRVLHREGVPLAWAAATLCLVADAAGRQRWASRYQPFDSGFDPDELQAARAWRRVFEQAALPKGATTFSRSSGPGGQHVNKTETKATTTWTVGELAGVVPALLQSRLRNSRYYTRSTDSLMVQAQTQRSRSANADENRQKLFAELVRLYEETVPGETDAGKADKYKAIAKTFHENRVRDKKCLSSKKQSRRGGGFDG